MTTEVNNETVQALARDYRTCCEINEADAARNAAHIFEYVLAVDETGKIRRKESMIPFCWLKHVVTDAEKFQAYREHLRANSGQKPDWAKEGFGCQISIVPFLSKGEDTVSEFYLPILLQPMGVQDKSGNIALAQTQVIDWQDKSNTIS